MVKFSGIAKGVAAHSGRHGAKNTSGLSAAFGKKSVEDVKPPNIENQKIVNQNVADWKATAAKYGVGGAVAAGAGGLAYEKLKHDGAEVLTTIGDTGRRVYDNMGNPLTSLHDGASHLEEELLEAAQRAAHIVPNVTEGLGGITTKVTVLLAVGLGIFIVYEAYNFSR